MTSLTQAFELIACDGRKNQAKYFYEMPYIIFVFSLSAQLKFQKKYAETTEEKKHKHRQPIEEFHKITYNKHLGFVWKANVHIKEIAR